VLSSRHVVAFTDYPFLLDFSSEGLEDGAEPPFEDAALVVVSEAHVAHEEEMLEEETAVVKDVDALAEGQLCREDDVGLFGGVQTVEGETFVESGGEAG
jgi:hypothetical protein